jgi:hypothetical protein
MVFRPIGPVQSYSTLNENSNTSDGLMKRIRRTLVAALVLLLAIAGWWFWHLRSTSQTRSSVAEPLRKNGSAANAFPDLASSFVARLDDSLGQLKISKDPEANRRILAELRKLLDGLPRDVASREIQSFLASGKDAQTQLDVTIKQGGDFGDASSLRVFLLDYLGKIDHPAAGAVAEQILSRYTTPDEWAVSLRNYAWANQNPAAQDYLEKKARELLANPEWRTNPTAGFLEAFDTIVYAHGTSLAPELAELVRDKENRALSHAAYLTLDRLTITEPAAMLKQLVEQPELMQGREQTRANFVARTDVRDPTQRALLEQYLLDPARGPEELATFAGIYPNGNYMVSDNMLTTVETIQGQEIVARDLNALETIEQWQADPRFERLNTFLTLIRERLLIFVRQANSGGQ